MLQALHCTMYLIRSCASKPEHVHRALSKSHEPTDYLNLYVTFAKKESFGLSQALQMEFSLCPTLFICLDCCF